MKDQASKAVHKKVREAKDAVNIKKQAKDRWEETKYRANPKARIEDLVADEKSEVGKRVAMRDAKKATKQRSSHSSGSWSGGRESSEDDLKAWLWLIGIAFVIAYWYIVIPLGTLYLIYQYNAKEK